jgi:serine/threonine protein phosphatase 1
MVLTDAGTLDDNQRLYVIGDIHGRADLLDQVALAIDRDLADNPARAATTITLGDYVDRGPDSRGVLDRLARNPFPTAYIALKGNHEELFGWFMRDPGVGPQWRHLGGLETLHLDARRQHGRRGNSMVHLSSDRFSISQELSGQDGS